MTRSVTGEANTRRTAPLCSRRRDRFCNTCGYNDYNNTACPLTHHLYFGNNAPAFQQPRTYFFTFIFPFTSKLSGILFYPAACGHLNTLCFPRRSFPRLDCSEKKLLVINQNFGTCFHHRPTSSASDSYRVSPHQ